MIRLNKQLGDNLDYYDDSVERRYADFLIDNDEAIIIDNLIVDVPQLIKRRFTCHTDICVGRTQPEDLADLSCCSSFSVRMAPEEKKRVEKAVPWVKERYPYIAKEIDESNNGEWWFYDDEDYNMTLERKKNGGCIFLTHKEDGFYKCSLHSVCLDKGKDPKKHKPAACVMFPLFLLELENGELLLTCTSKETRHVIDPDGTYHHFDCLCPNNIATKPLYEDMGSVIAYMFGDKVYEKIVHEAHKREKADR